MQPRPITRILVAVALVLVLFGLLVFDGFDTATGSWFILVGCLVGLVAIVLQLVPRSRA
ncbi:MAG: hypothetical protein ACR2HP_04175 [Ilumatobacteraceae bacterium]